MALLMNETMKSLRIEFYGCCLQMNFDNNVIHYRSIYEQNEKSP